MLWTPIRRGGDLFWTSSRSYPPFPRNYTFSKYTSSKGEYFDVLIRPLFITQKETWSFLEGSPVDYISYNSHFTLLLFLALLLNYKSWQSSRGFCCWICLGAVWRILVQFSCLPPTSTKVILMIQLIFPHKVVPLTQHQDVKII